MKNINKIGSKIMFLAFTLLLVISCSDDFLRDEKRDGLSDEVVFASDATASAAIIGVYDVLQGGPAEYITKAIFYPANFLTQDYLNIGADTFFQTFEIPTVFAPFNALWIQNYAGIGRANTALENLAPAVEAGNVSGELGNRLIGESYGMRGMLYSMLASNFGGVPLVLRSAGGDADPFAPRNTQDEIFQQVVLDMQEAIARLPWEYDEANKGRFTKGAAYAYMGSAYMWLGQYDKAITAFEVLDAHYTLEEDFLAVHADENKNGKESIFEIQLTDASGNLSWGRDDNVTFIQSFSMPNEIANGGGYSAAAKVLYDSFEEGDKRKLYSVIGPGDEHPDPLINISDYPNVQANYGGINTVGTIENPWLGSDGLPGRQGYYNVKLWRNPAVDGWSGPNIFGGQNIILMRYAEVLLSLAESYHRAGNDGQAMATLMRVRNRGGLITQPTGDFIDSVISEYRHELAGEFSLWYLLRRTGEHVRYLQEEFGVTVPNGRDLIPIPQEQIDANPNLVQNPGY